MKNPAIYVVTFYDFNHQQRKMPLDPRFLETDKNFIFYLIDPEVPEPLQHKRCILESQIDPTLVYPGRVYLAEWSLLLAEYRHRFCEYPFFMTSSRFYEKNTTLRTDLNLEWDRLFSFFDHYRWGYLPSYDRSSPFMDGRTPVIPLSTYYTEQGIQLLSDLYGPHFNNLIDTPYSGDFYCNYVGFKDRAALEEYVEYYLPIIDRFFTPDWTPREDLQKYLVQELTYRNFKPFTLLLETGSHQFFFDTRTPYFAMNYDGYYEMHENTQSFARVQNLSTAENSQTKQLDGHPIRITSCPLRDRTCATSRITETRPAAKLVRDPILSFKLSEIFDHPPFYLDLDSGRGIPMLSHSIDISKALCIDGGDYNQASIVNDIWSKYSKQAVNGDAYGHLRITTEDTDAPIQFDLVSAFNIPDLPQHLYGNLVRNILVHLHQQSVVLLNFDKGSLKHAHFILSAFAREGVLEDSFLKDYLSQSTWLHNGFKDGTVRALSNAPDVFEKRLARKATTQEFLFRYQDSIAASVDIMRQLIEIQPNILWTNYLLHLKDILEHLTAQISRSHR